MRKILCAIYVALQSSVAFAADISITWSAGENTYTLKSFEKEDGPETVQAYNQICATFQKEDPTANRHLPEEEFDKFRDHIINTRAEGLKTGETSLLLVYKNNELVGGTYYMTEEGGEIVRMSCAGFKMDLDKQELGMLQGQALTVLTSKSYFKKGKKLLATVNESSIHIPLLQHFGFVKSEYPVESDVPAEKYLTFEKHIGISMTWEVGDHTFKLKEEALDPAKTEIYSDICLKFHMADDTARKVVKGVEMSDADFEAFAKKKIADRVQWAQDGIASLVLLYKDDSIVGGTCYLQEQNETVIRMSFTGFKLDLNQTEMGIAQMQTLNALGSKKYFPKGEKLIVCLRNDSAYIPILEAFGFTKSDYAVEAELSADEFSSFERAVK